MEPEDSSPPSQVPATCPYPEPAQSRPCPYIPLPEDPSYWTLWGTKFSPFLQNNQRLELRLKSFFPPHWKPYVYHKVKPVDVV